MPCDCEQSTLDLKPEIICVQKSSTESITVEIPWCPALPSGVTIDTSVWTVIEGTCTLSGEAPSGFVTRATISDGDAGSLCILHNTIGTDTGLTLVQVVECYVSNAYVPIVPHC